MSKTNIVEHVLKTIKEQEIKFVDFRFTDYSGQWLHITHCADTVSEEELTKGIAFDGSSVAAWKEINQSDMLLMPDLSTVFIDPFNNSSTMVITCDTIDPVTNAVFFIFV